MATALQQPEGNLDNVASNGEQRKAAEQQRAEKARRLQELNLQREHILSQRTSSPARRSALEAALAHIESQITALG